MWTIMTTKSLNGFELEERVREQKSFTAEWKRLKFLLWFWLCSDGCFWNFIRHFFPSFHAICMYIVQYALPVNFGYKLQQILLAHKTIQFPPLTACTNMWFTTLAQPRTIKIIRQTFFSLSYIHRTHRYYTLWPVELIQTAKTFPF